MQRLLLARLGLGGDVLGYPVQPSEGLVLYVAGDRPKQAGRSFRRMVTDPDRQVLRERLRVHRGALPFDLVREPDRLTEWAKELGATDVFLDSLGSLVGRLTDDETGSAISRAFTLAVTEGLEVVSNHHPRKATGENKKPREIADVYGSRWITACHGSILCLWATPATPSWSSVT